MLTNLKAAGAEEVRERRPYVRESKILSTQSAGDCEKITISLSRLPDTTDVAMGTRAQYAAGIDRLDRVM